MSASRRWTWIAAMLVVALAAGGWLIHQRRAAALADRPTADAPTPDAAIVTTLPLTFGPRDLMTVEPTQISRSIPLTGSLRPINQTVLRSKVAGEILELPVREGSVVKAGELIARIDPLDLTYRIKEREAQSRQIDAQVQQAQRTLDSHSQLLAKKFISQSAHDTARYAYEALLGARDAANAQLTMARKALRDATISAPFAGVIVERFAQPGEKVSPDNRIVSLVDLSRMEIEALVPASEIGSVKEGQRVTLDIEGIDTAPLGHVVRISPSTQTGTRSVPVYIGLDNRDARIRAGLFAQGRLVTAVHRDALVVPETALRDVAGRLFVYAIEQDRLVERDVKLGLRDASSRKVGAESDDLDGASTTGASGRVEITDGLKAGDRIVAVNLGTLRAGSTVRIEPKAAH